MRGNALNINDYVIVSDFDGTITCVDSNDLLCQMHGDEKNAQIEKDFRAGVLGFKKAVIQHFDALRVSLEAYHSFLDNNIHIDPDFDEFLHQVNKRDIPFFIVSGGYRPAIVRLLGSERLSGVEVFANDLRGDEYLKPVFAHTNVVCNEPFGPCGNCKKVCIETIRKQTNRDIIYIGDGLTDRCASKKANLIFAKGDFAHYCHSNGLPFISFESFADITKFINGDNT
jgi:2-hydroxy-3-keto-5-methylthiopentenyl-1-phosphate phosphatase